MIINTSLSALAAGEQVELAPGDVLCVSCSFKYVVAEAVTVVLWASLGLGIGRDIENFEEISLEATLTPKTWTGDIDILIPSGKTAGTYWLRAEIEGYPDTQTTIPDAAVIAGVPGIFDAIGPLLVMGLMFVVFSTMTPMMEEGFSS